MIYSVGPTCLMLKERLRNVCDDVSGLSGAQLIAAQIRRLAHKNFPSEPFDTYFYASAAFNFRLLRVSTLSARQG